MPDHRGFLKFSYDHGRTSDSCRFGFATSDPYHDERVKSYDNMLHQTLRKIFRERCPSSDKTRELLLASEHTDRNSVIVKLILEQEPSLNEIFPEESKLSLLWMAVLRCYQYSAELLVRSGADVNVRCGIKVAPFLSETITILHLVLQTYPSSWSERFIALLLDHGFDLRARDSHGQTVLHYAVNYGHVQATALLLDRGADVNVADIDGKTPLLEAARSSEADEIAPLLVKHGADVSVRDSDGRNALHLLAMAFEERTELAGALIKLGVKLDDREYRQPQYQPIHNAALKGKNKLVKLFLDCGADVNARAKDGVFPLYIAAEYNKSAVLLTLLKHGANVNLKTTAGRTALHRACVSIHANYSRANIKVLLSLGADMFAEDRDGKTPFALIRDKNTENPMMRLALRTLALRNACQHKSIEYYDKMIIADYPQLWTYYKECVEQIRKLKSTRFVESCAFFDLLTKCQCQVAALWRRNEVARKVSRAGERSLGEKLCATGWMSRLGLCLLRSVNFLFERTASAIEPKPKFEIEFRKYNLNVVPAYAEDILEAFERAQAHYHAVLELEILINEAFYDALPWMVVRKVILYALGCDCEKTKLVHASWGCADNLNLLF